MVAIESLLAVTIAVIVILVALWYVRRSLREEFDEATEHIDPDANADPSPSPGAPGDTPGHTKGGTSIPITARTKALSTPAKIMFGSIGGIILIIAIFTFNTIRTGSPSEMLFASQLADAGKVLVGTVVGIIAVNWREKSEGTLHNIYETESGDAKPEPIPVDTSSVRADDEGNPIVTQYASERVLGLFRRYKHVGEDPTLDGTHRAPGKPVTHQIPEHAIEVDDGTWVNRTARRSPTESPDVDADYTYSSPIELSYDAYVEIKESNRRKDIRLSNLEATVAVLEKELEKLTRRLKSGQYKEEDQILGKIEKVADIVDSASSTENGHSDPRSTHVSLNGQRPGHNAPDQTAQTDGGNR